MKNLHLLIFGSTEKEIRENCAKALDEAFCLYEATEDKEWPPSKLGPEFELEFRAEKSMMSIIDGYIKRHEII